MSDKDKKWVLPDMDPSKLRASRLQSWERFGFPPPRREDEKPVRPLPDMDPAELKAFSPPPREAFRSPPQEVGPPPPRDYKRPATTQAPVLSSARRLPLPEPPKEQPPAKVDDAKEGFSFSRWLSKLFSSSTTSASSTPAKTPVSSSSQPVLTTVSNFSRVFASNRKMLGPMQILVSFLDNKDILALKQTGTAPEKICNEYYYRRLLLAEIGPDLKKLINKWESAEEAYHRHREIWRSSDERSGPTGPMLTATPERLAEYAKKIIDDPYYVSYHIGKKNFSCLENWVHVPAWQAFFYEQHLIEFLKKNPSCIEKVFRDATFWKNRPGVPCNGGLRLLQVLSVNFPSHAKLLEKYALPEWEHGREQASKKPDLALISRRVGIAIECLRSKYEGDTESKSVVTIQGEDQLRFKMPVNDSVSSDNEAFYQEQLQKNIGPNLQLLIKEGEAAFNAYQRHLDILRRLSAIKVMTIPQFVARMQDYPNYYLHQIISKAEFVCIFPTVDFLASFIAHFTSRADVIMEYTCDRPGELSAGKEMLMHFLLLNIRKGNFNVTEDDFWAPQPLEKFPKEYQPRILKIVYGLEEFLHAQLAKYSMERSIENLPEQADQIVDYVLKDPQRIKTHLKKFWSLKYVEKHPNSIDRIMQVVMGDIEYCKSFFNTLSSDVRKNPELFARYKHQIVKSMLMKAPIFRCLVGYTFYLKELLNMFDAYSGHIMACVLANNADFCRIFKQPGDWSDPVFSPWKQQIEERWAMNKIVKEDAAFITFDVDLPLSDPACSVVTAFTPVTSSSVTTTTTTTSSSSSRWNPPPADLTVSQTAVPGFWDSVWWNPPAADLTVSQTAAPRFWATSTLSSSISPGSLPASSQREKSSAAIPRGEIKQTADAKAVVDLARGDAGQESNHTHPPSPSITPAGSAS